jgi:hypothetical protein
VDRQRRTQCMASLLARFESSGFLPVGTPKNPCVCSSCWQQRGTSPSHCGCLSDYLQLPQHLWTDAAVYDETCQGMHWISWRAFWALIINVHFSHNSQIKCFPTHSDEDILSNFICGTCVHSLSAPFSYTCIMLNGMIKVLWQIWRYFRHERCYSMAGYGFGRFLCNDFPNTWDREI